MFRNCAKYDRVKKVLKEKFGHSFSFSLFVANVRSAPRNNYFFAI